MTPILPDLIILTFNYTKISQLWYLACDMFRVWYLGGEIISLLNKFLTWLYSITCHCFEWNEKDLLWARCGNIKYGTGVAIGVNTADHELTACVRFFKPKSQRNCWQEFGTFTDLNFQSKMQRQARIICSLWPFGQISKNKHFLKLI